MGELRELRLFVRRAVRLKSLFERFRFMRLRILILTSVELGFVDREVG